MNITRPTLPPRKGYVEVVDKDGNHVYKATAEQERQEQTENRLADIGSALKSLLGEENANGIAQQINAFLQMAVQTADLTEEQSMRVADLYQPWKENQSYAAGDIVKYGVNADGETQLYQVLQAHTSQSDWTPDTAVSLFKAIGFADDGTSVWTQPLGATDAYMQGDTVSHNGKTWVSDIDNNVWEPGVYGWTEKA